MTKNAKKNTKENVNGYVYIELYHNFKFIYGI